MAERRHYHRQYLTNRFPNGTVSFSLLFFFLFTTTTTTVCIVPSIQPVLGFAQPPLSSRRLPTFRHCTAQIQNRRYGRVVRYLSEEDDNTIGNEVEEEGFLDLPFDDTSSSSSSTTDVALSELKQDVVALGGSSGSSGSSSNTMDDDTNKNKSKNSPGLDNTLSSQQDQFSSFSSNGSSSSSQSNVSAVIDTDNTNDPKISDEELVRKVNAASSRTKFDVSPPLTFRKYLVMQGKRVPVTIRYSGQVDGQVSGLRSFYLTAAKKITESHPDVIVEKMILPPVEGESVFEVLVDGRVVIGKGRSKWQSVSRNMSSSYANNGMSIFISMQEIDAAIAKARRKRRPATAYVRNGAEEGNTPAVRLEMLKVGSDNDGGGK